MCFLPPAKKGLRIVERNAMLVPQRVDGSDHIAIVEKVGFDPHHVGDRAIGYDGHARIGVVAESNGHRCFGKWL